MQVALYLAGEITQVLDAIPWVRCASGNVFLQFFTSLRFSLFLTVFRHFSLFLTVYQYHCFSPFSTIFHCFSPFLTVFRRYSLFFTVSLCGSMCCWPCWSGRRLGLVGPWIWLAVGLVVGPWVWWACGSGGFCGVSTDKSPTLRGPTCQGVLGLVFLWARKNKQTRNKANK